ncbi:MAG: transglycosylase domain-containing protein [Acetobacteraceae bacterium]
MRRKIVAVMAALFIAGGLAVALALLSTPTAAEAVVLVRAEARRHGTAYPGPEPPHRFVAALTATEDQRFYSPLDPGIDPFAVGRVILGWMTGRPDQGGSTIAQQLAKMLYTPGRTGSMAELEQMALAIKLNFAYPKAGILSMYAEVAYFGSGHYGLRSASCGYFDRQPAELSWAQAAMLAGVVNAPTALDPRTHPRRAEEREAHVFARLVAVGALARGEANAMLARPLGLVPVKRSAGALSCTPRGRS